MRIIVTGGGTGGHFYPALAVMEELARNEAEVELAYVGTRKGIEARILPAYPWIHFYPIHVRGFSRGRAWQNLYAGLLLCVAIVEALLVLVRFRPCVVIGMGGYSSFPAVMLGAILGRLFNVRTLIHEQNMVAGLANRLLGPVVNSVLISYPQTSRYFSRARRVVVTGNPVRREFRMTRRTAGLYRRFGLDPERKTVLVFGGSNGSAALVEGVLRTKELILENSKIQVLLVTGAAAATSQIRKELSAAGVKNVVARRYIDHMGEAFSLADLVVTRAGASTLAEITACGKPAMLIPWREATDDHQWKNARYLEQEKACLLVSEKQVHSRGLFPFIEEMIADDRALSQMAGNSSRLGKPAAAAAVLGEICTLARGV
ncbi:MAG: undecaprenyldiphospho-muramoylpentapeptide beta-N-acetylglucosaminyltransferase [Candidatus Bipolaricaulota bacterium]|nr:undecaprenyldiphospho-muramoylpentapeptide beta-N-acetylglucosaminyltransferase [Candidatus Bipolaricaulota bacterium]